MSVQESRQKEKAAGFPTWQPEAVATGPERSNGTAAERSFGMVRGPSVLRLWECGS